MQKATAKPERCTTVHSHQHRHNTLAQTRTSCIYVRRQVKAAKMDRSQWEWERESQGRGPAASNLCAAIDGSGFWLWR